jgi:hypothetical protein
VGFIRFWGTDAEQASDYHLNDAVLALSLKLTAEEFAALEERYRPHPVLGFS